MSLRLFEDPSELGNIIQLIYQKNVTSDFSNLLLEESKITANLYLTNQLDAQFKTCGFRKNKFNASMLEIYECGLKHRGVQSSVVNILDIMAEHMTNEQFRVNDLYEVFACDIQHRIGKATLYTDLVCANMNGCYIGKLITDFIFRNAQYKDSIVKQTLIDFLCSDVGQLFICICQEYTIFDVALSLRLNNRIDDYKVLNLHRNLNGSLFILALNVQTGVMLFDNIEACEIENMFMFNTFDFTFNHFLKYRNPATNEYQSLTAFMKEYHFERGV